MKTTKKIYSVLITLISFFCNLMITDALPSSIILNNSSNTNYYCPFSSLAASHCSSYITMTTKTDLLGNSTYCLNRGKGMPTPSNGIKSLTKGSRMNKSAGYSYILENGYPNKSITGNNQKDNYITQLAIWWYRDTNQVNPNIKASSNELAIQAKKLVDNAKIFQKKYDAFDDDSDGAPKLTTTIISSFDIVGDNYVAEFKVNSSTSLITTYSMFVTANSNYTETVTDSSDNKVSLSALKIGTTYKIKIPTSSFKTEATSLSLSFKATGNYTRYSSYLYDSNNGYYQDLILYDKVTKSISTPKKLNIYRKGVKFSKIDITDGDEIEGAKLTVTAAEDIKDSENVVKYKQGEVVDSWTSSSEEVHYIADMLPGKYIFNEVTAPLGYEKVDSIEFVVNTDNTIQKVTMKDQSKPCYIWVAKVDSDKGNMPIGGATLVIKDKSGNVVKTLTSQNMAYTRIATLEAGTYTLEETKAPEGYQNNSEKEEFTIINNGGNTCGTVRIADTMYPSKIKVAKVDTKDNYIEGAELEIREAQSGTTIKTLTSTTDLIELDLDVGSYYLVETKAPSGYTISNEIVKFQVNNDGGIEQVIKLTNDLTPEVPNTLASISKVIYIAAGLAIIIGLYLIYKNKFTRKTNTHK